MKDGIYGRNKQDLKKTLDESCKCNKILAKKLKEERKKYQKLYIEYLKLERKLKKCGNL